MFKASAIRDLCKFTLATLVLTGLFSVGVNLDSAYNSGKIVSSLTHTSVHGKQIVAGIDDKHICSPVKFATN